MCGAFNERRQRTGSPINMNPLNLIKLRPLYARFKSDHPKLSPFFRAALAEMREGTVVEVRVTPPEGRTIVTNVKINQEDMELIRELKAMK